MLDELFDLFDRNDNRRQRQGGIRGFVSRLTGDEEDRDASRNRGGSTEPMRRDDDEYDDEDRYRRDRSRRRSDDPFDFD
jgi:hypothetical protein